MVISKGNTAFGVCPHHLLPVIYRISMAYIPTLIKVANFCE
jgi:GTP cyclohydrolase I